MRERAVFLAVLLAAAALAAALVRSNLPRQDSAAIDDAGRQASPSASIGVGATESPTASPTATASVVQEARPSKLPPHVRVDPASPQECPDSMVLVDGIYCPFVGHRCSRFVSEPDDICERFAPDVICEGRLQKRRFCIDVYEYPNIPGVRPAMMIELDEAKRACAVEGKRLCTVEEWEFACEGTQMWPYPYGIERDQSACNIDKPGDAPSSAAMSDPWAVSDAAEQADKRAPSGSSDTCVSPFGARDMTGNVDEWVEDSTAKLEGRPITAALKGGSWSPARARCRPIGAPPAPGTKAFGVGFRCCADTNSKERPMSLAPATMKLPRRRTMDRGTTPAGSGR